jgi:hypothetical protein
MDVGIDRLIEMFEERFGRRAATALLFLIGLGVVALAIHSFVTLLVLPTVRWSQPIWRWLLGGPVALPVISNQDFLRAVAAGIATSFAFLMVYYVIGKAIAGRFQRKADATMAEIKRADQELRAMLEEARSLGLNVDDLKKIGSGKTAPR